VTDPEVEVLLRGRPVSGIICLLLGMRRISSRTTVAFPSKSAAAHNTSSSVRDWAVTQLSTISSKQWSTRSIHDILLFSFFVTKGSDGIVNLETAASSLLTCQMSCHQEFYWVCSKLFNLKMDLSYYLYRSAYRLPLAGIISVTSTWCI